ncbi:MAG: heparinase II/III family protein [Tunicatimonas sp.]
MKTTTRPVILISLLVSTLLACFYPIPAPATPPADDPPKLENPMDVAYLKKNLRKSSPRLILTPATEKQLKKKLKTDPVVQNMYAAIRLNAQQIQTEPLLERVMEGRRLLATSREMLRRVNVLGMVHRIDGDQAALDRLNDELLAVCAFSDWNPSHYLDVAEMALAVALAIDWAGDDLPKATVVTAKDALINKGIMPSYTPEGSRVRWITGTNNWNQVCHGGMIAASIAVAELNPELAARTISRALDNMPHALAEYGPDGVYPEGSTYWGYGTSFSVLTSSLLETAFGTDFGLAAYPAFLESATFRKLSIAPSGWYYNFADCGDQRSENGDVTLAWFATKTGNDAYFEKERFLRPPEEMGELARYAGAGLVWLAQFEPQRTDALPLAWKGDGANPIVVFRDPARQYYFGGKGGRGTVNHGNMDAGSFVFELDGVRWVIDPGNQNYNDLEQTGFNLWGSCQDCERWTLLTKNNYGHSTLTVNNALHVADGFAPISEFKDGDQPEATVELSEAFGGKLKSATRRFVKENDHALLIEDTFTPSDSTQSITWQLMTTAEVDVTADGAILKQDGKQLTLKNLSHPALRISVISLDPPPLKLDRRIENLKRLEIRVPAYKLSTERNTLRVRLSADSN